MDRNASSLSARHASPAGSEVSPFVGKRILVVSLGEDSVELDQQLVDQCVSPSSDRHSEAVIAVIDDCGATVGKGGADYLALAVEQTGCGLPRQQFLRTLR